MLVFSPDGVFGFLEEDEGEEVGKNGGKKRVSLKYMKAEKEQGLEKAENPCDHKLPHKSLFSTAVPPVWEKKT